MALAMCFKIYSAFSLLVPKSRYPGVVLAIDFKQYTLATNAMY